MKVQGMVALLLLGALILAGATSWAGATAADVSRRIEALSLPHGQEISGAFQTGLSQGSLSATDALSLIERLGATGGSASDQDAILLIVARALEDNLPVSMLLSKAAEGLARGVSLPVIAQDLSLRERLLAEVRDLLYSKSIFRAAEGTPAVPPALPNSRFDLLVTHIAASLGDSLDGGGNPLDGYALLAEVTKRLNLLKGSVIPTDDVELVLSRIDATDLTRTALEALNQNQK